MIKCFKFKDHKNDLIQIFINEELQLQFGFYTWPSAIKLCEYLIEIHSSIKNKVILELGCGTGLVGVLCSKLGAKKIFMTDSSDQLKNSHFLVKSLDRNKISYCSSEYPAYSQENAQIILKPLNWGEISDDLIFFPPIDLIVASDCFYSCSDFDPILATVSYFLQLNPSSSFCTSYQIRSLYRNLEPLLIKWNLSANQVFVESSKTVDEDEFEEDKNDNNDKSEKGEDGEEGKVIIDNCDVKKNIIDYNENDNEKKENKNENEKSNKIVDNLNANSYEIQIFEIKLKIK